MIPVYSPNLPTEKVSAAVVGSVDPRVIRSLEALGVWTIAAGPNRSLPAALCRHADMLVHPLGNGEVLAAQGEGRLCNALSGFGFAVTFLKKELAPHYPGDVALNAARIGSRLVCNEQAAAPELLEAARRMSRRTPGVASDSLCMLVVCNTASIQLIPTTVAGVRAAAGCATPFDILPAVWLASAISVCVGIAACKVLRRLSRELPVPLIAGGLLSDKADVLASLGAGALCVSASDESLWAL